MDTNIDNQRAQHPWRGRRPRGMNVSQFAEMLRNHTFCFRQAVYGSEMTPEALEAMIPNLDQEMAIYRHAWEGGDEFMRILAGHMARQRQALIPSKTQDDAAAEELLSVLDEDLRGYAFSLGRFDWYWAFSDDDNVQRNGEAGESELKKKAETKGGYYKKLFDKYVKERHDNITRPR